MAFKPLMAQAHVNRCQRLAHEHRILCDRGKTVEPLFLISEIIAQYRAAHIVTTRRLLPFWLCEGRPAAIGLQLSLYLSYEPSVGVPK